jgi:hypothetical protein
MLKRSFLIIFIIVIASSVFSRTIPENPSIPGLNQPETPANRNISVDDLDTYSIEDLVNNLLGDGVSVSNIDYIGTNNSAGIFTNGISSGLEFDSGVILSSGFADGISGPNNSSGYTGVLNTPGDSELNTLIPGYTTFDATILEFDFVPNSNGITFSYIFASDEYLEYVNSSFNDVFGFFLNGSNVPLVPNTTVPVSINNVNHLSNTDYFYNNDIHSGPGMGYPPTVIYNIEADGFTTELTVEAHVNQGQQNHIRFAIADAGDRILDSWVFMKAGSFTSLQLTPLEVLVDGGVLQETDEDVPIDINVSAIGLNNADFNWVLSNPIWGSAQFIFDRYAQENRTIRYTPNPNYNGYGTETADSFVLAVSDNLGHTVYTVIGIAILPVNDPPQNTVPPQISGDFIVGNEVSCDPGEWNDDIDNQYVGYQYPESIITLSYQWQRSLDREWEDIALATEETYLLQPEDAEHNIRCLVIAEDDGIGSGEDNTTILASNEEYCEMPIGSDDDLISLPTSIISVSPNPFNPSTRIAYHLGNDANVNINIFNIKGKLIRTLINKYHTAGEYLIEWDGIDEEGKTCSSGIYFSILRSGNNSDTAKLILLK